MALLNAGDRAPDFQLQTDEGRSVSLAALSDKPIVLFFYPKDDTPGCTIECKEFRDARTDFIERAHVFGISPDDVLSHQAFRDKYALNFPLLSDPGHQVALQFGVWGPRKNFVKADWIRALLGEASRAAFVCSSAAAARRSERHRAPAKL